MASSTKSSNSGMLCSSHRQSDAPNSARCLGRRRSLASGLCYNITMSKKPIIKIFLIVLPIITIGLLLLQGYQSCAYREMSCIGPDYSALVWLTLSAELILAAWSIENNYETKRKIKISTVRRVAQLIGISVISLILAHVFVYLTPVCGWIVQLGKNLG